MEINSNEKEDQVDQSPSLNAQNMDQNPWQKSYINDQISDDGKPRESDDEHTDGPSSRLPQRISDVPDGDKHNSDIEAEEESSDEEAKTDPGTAIRIYKGEEYL